MTVNQKDIAHELNLSIATVSRSLRGHSDIRPETREKVINLASKMGYRPWENIRRHGRQGAASGKLTTVGVLVCWPDEIKREPNVAANHMLAGISAEADKLNVSIATHFVPPERCLQIIEPQHQFPAMRAGMMSGMLLIYPFPREAVRDLSTMMPCVSMVHPYTDLGIDCIDNDHAAGIDMVVNHLYRLGHRRIGFVGAPRSSAWAYSRFAGYMRSLDRLSLSCDFSIVINATRPKLDSDTQVEIITENLKKGVTAWVCADDFVGYDLYPLLTAKGLRIPQDVSLVGFSGLGPRYAGCPPLTSVHPPYEQMGAAALRRLMDRTKRTNEPVQHIQFGCKFVEGETTGPPKA